MPVKKKRRKVAKVAVKATPAPVHLDNSWGVLTDDVAASMDWSSLTQSFDDMTSKRLWAKDLTHGALSQKLPLKIVTGSRGEPVPLLATVQGEQKRCAPDVDSQPPSFILSSDIVLKESPGKGRGFFARKALPAGSMVLIERPLVAALDVEWRQKKWADCASADSVALGVQLAKAFSPSLCQALARMHPQEGSIPDLPDAEESEDEDETAALAEAVETAWSAVTELSDAAKERWRAVVRLNSLGFYTNSEQLCHTGNFTALTGSGLYALASIFNHSCAPTLNRFSIGDLTMFITNRPLDAGAELCITYIESELLCAPISMRRQSLNRDFVCACPKCQAEVARGSDKATGGPQRRYLTVDANVQAQLSLLPPADRVEAVLAALRGEEDAEDEEEEEEGHEDLAGPAVVLGKDAQELRVAQAMALMQMRDFAKALEVWRRLAAFACHHCPPYDESVPVYATQAALCAFMCGSDKVANDYVAKAFDAHRVSCGALLFGWRFRKEVELSFVPEEAKAKFLALVDAREGALTGASNSTGTSAETRLPTPPLWESVVGAWGFAADEIPGAQEQS